MVKERVLWTINIALVLVAVVLVLNLLEIGLPTLGRAQYWLDNSEPVCIASFEDQNSLIDMNACCYGLQMQLGCESWRSPVMVGEEILMVDKKCSTGKSAIAYFVNMKAYNDCKFN